MTSEDTAFGFNFGSLKVERIAHVNNGAKEPCVIINCTTKKRKIEIHACGGGKMSIYELDKNGRTLGELKQIRRRNDEVATQVEQ